MSQKKKIMSSLKTKNQLSRLGPRKKKKKKRRQLDKDHVHMHMNIFVNQEKMHPYLVSSLFLGENIFYKVKEKTNT